MALAIVVITILAIMVSSMVLFSGSQTGSMQNSLAARTARANALAGIKAAAAKLKNDGRWYGGDGTPGSGTTLGVLGPGDIGLSTNDVNFVVVVKDMKSTKALTNVTYAGQLYQELTLLGRIDIYSRGECETPDGGRYTSVFYARLIVSPEPCILGSSMKGLVFAANTGALQECPHTMLRLARITDINEVREDNPNLDAIFDNPSSDLATEKRDIVRDYVDGERAHSFITNYGKVNWTANPTPPAGDKTDDGTALNFLEEYVKAPPPNPGVQFMYDRIFDFLFDGNDPGDWDGRHDERFVDLELPEPSSDLTAMKNFIRQACQKTGTPWVERHPEKEFRKEDALEQLHSHEGVSPTMSSTSDYISELSYNPQAQVAYDVSWQATAISTSASQAMADTGVGGPWLYSSYSGQAMYYLGLSVEGPRDVLKPYWIRDEAAGIDKYGYRIDDLANFWTKYYVNDKVDEPAGYEKTHESIGVIPVSPGGGGGGGSNTGGGGSMGGAF